MEICFFTMANAKLIKQARSLLLSGDACGRPVWFYRIPEDNDDPARYKIHLLQSDLLPAADKYVFLDADCLMIKAGDWEADDCWGAKRESWNTADKGYRDVFKAGGFDAYKRLYQKAGSPPRLNSGVFVLPKDILKTFGQEWEDWNLRIDALSPERLWVRDQMGYMFVHNKHELPILPDRFHCIVKRESVNEDHVLLHAAGHPRGNRKKRYTDAIGRVLGGNLDDMGKASRNYRWQVLAELIMRYAEDPAHPVIAELGVFKGETTRHLLQTFPGLRMYCVDNRKPPGAEQRAKGIDAAWDQVMADFPGRVTFYKDDVLNVTFPEKLDGIFDDSDHRTEAVIAHAWNHWGGLKPGGFYAVHDIDQADGSYYSMYSVRIAFDRMWPGLYETGPDHTAWVIKDSQGYASAIQDDPLYAMRGKS